MGEHSSFRILRGMGVATLVVASVVALSSCSQAGDAPGGAVSSPAAETVQSAAPSVTPSPTETIASDAPLPTASDVVTSAPTSSTDSRTAVQPAITTADWDASAKALDVSAIVPGITEGGGTCTVTVTSGSTVRTASSTGVAASSYTGCPAVAITGLTPGSWQVRVRYASEGSVGSAEKTATVPNG